jgi:hypothetical protein
MRNCQHAYLHGYYYEPSGAVVPTILERIGRPDLAASIRGLLDRDIGGLTLRNALSSHRNASIAHPTFTHERNVKVLSADSKLFAAAHVDLIKRTAALHRLLRRLYPGIARTIDNFEPPFRRWKPPTVGIVPGTTWRSWDSLSDLEQQQIVWMIESLRAFRAGREVGFMFPGSHFDRRREFVSDGLSVYLYSFYANDQKEGLLPVLRELNCADLVRHGEALLKKPVGKTTFIEALALLRARLITHQHFSFSRLQEELEAKGMETEESADEFVGVLAEVQAFTDGLLPALNSRYPEAAKPWRQTPPRKT